MKSAPTGFFEIARFVANWAITANVEKATNNHAGT
jgi:hypothetical protein